MSGAQFSEADEFGNITVTGLPASANSSTASIESMVVANTMKAVGMVESQVDAELSRLGGLDESALLSLRRQRLEELKFRAEKEQQWRAQGHGQYEEIPDQKQWFEENKLNDRVITHFFRGSTWRCELVDKHLKKISQKHIESKFIKIDAEKSPFLAEKLQIVLMPTIVCTKNNKVIDMIEGFDSLGGSDEFSTETLEKRLAQKGAIDVDESILMNTTTANETRGKKINEEKELLAEKNKKIRNGRVNNKKSGNKINFNRRVEKDEDSEEDEEDD